MRYIIIGSMKHYEKFDKIIQELEEKGHQVRKPENKDLPEPIPIEEKRKAMEEFNKNLEWADGIIVANYSKPGTNTLMEIGMAYNKGKNIILAKEPCQDIRHEMEAIGYELLNRLLSQPPR
ncbi:MAG: hypothetical protein ACQEP1_01545 [Nanobdellota archaeon]